MNSRSPSRSPVTHSSSHDAPSLVLMVDSVFFVWISAAVDAARLNIGEGSIAEDNKTVEIVIVENDFIFLLEFQG